MQFFSFEIEMVFWSNFKFQQSSKNHKPLNSPSIYLSHTYTHTHKTRVEFKKKQRFDVRFD
jgi:hypothetical protein